MNPPTSNAFVKPTKSHEGGKGDNHRTVQLVLTQSLPQVLHYKRLTRQRPTRCMLGGIFMAAPKWAEQASVRPALHDCDVSCMKGAQCALMPGVSQQGKGGKSMRSPSGGWTASEAGGKGACHMAP